MELHTLIGRAREQAQGRDLPLILSCAITITAGIYIFIIPFPYRTAIQEICFYSSLAFLALLYGFKTRALSFKTPLTGPLLLFTVWVLGSLFFSIDKKNSFHDFFAYLLKDLALFFLVYTVFGSRKRFTLLAWLIIISAGIFSIGGMIYFYAILQMPIATRIGLPEVGLGVNYIGYITVLAISFSITQFFHSRSGLGTWVSFFSVASATLATLFTQTKGTLLGFIPLLSLLFERKRLLVLVSMIVGLLIFVMPVRQLFTTGPEFSRHLEGGRFVIWSHYVQMIKDRPYAGIGFGMQTYRKEIINPDYEINPSYKEVFAPHNTFLDVAVRCGVPGLVLFLYILFAFARTGVGVIRYSQDPFIKGWALCLMAVFASYIIQGLFSDLFLGIQVKYFFIILSMMAILWKWHAESSSDINP